MWKEMILEFLVILEFVVMILGLILVILFILEFPINGKTWWNLH